MHAAGTSELSECHDFVPKIFHVSVSANFVNCFFLCLHAQETRPCVLPFPAVKACHGVDVFFLCGVATHCSHLPYVSVVVLQSYSGSEQILWRMNGVVEVMASIFSFGIKTHRS